MLTSVPTPVVQAVACVLGLTTTIPSCVPPEHLYMALVAAPICSAGTFTAARPVALLEWVKYQTEVGFAPVP